MIQAFATLFKGLKMNKATWDSLSLEAQRIWDQLPQKDKNTILRSRPGMSPSNTRGNPQGTPSGARPCSPSLSALRNLPNRQQVEFHEVTDNVPTIDQYQTHFLERGNYTVNNATQHTDDTTVALSNDTFYTPKPSEECNIFNVLTTTPPRVTAPNDKSSSAETGESSGSSDKNYKSLFRRIPKPRLAHMAVVVNSCPWEFSSTLMGQVRPRTSRKLKS